MSKLKFWSNYRDLSSIDGPGLLEIFREKDGRTFEARHYRSSAAQLSPQCLE